MIIDDFKQVRDVDILTQQQYLGTKFDQMSEEEQNSHLVSRKSEFQINVDTGYCFVAEKDGKIVGFILAHELLPFRRYLYIRYICIHPDLQGVGIGSLLYNKLIDKAKQNGVKEIRSLINLDNSRSIKLHEKVGFILNDRKEAVLKVGEKG